MVGEGGGALQEVDREGTGVCTIISFLPLRGQVQKG